LAFETKALSEWQALDGSVKEPLRKLLKKRLMEPRTPGAELHGDLRDCYKSKLRKQGYRLIYRVIDYTLLVLVLAVDKRDGDSVYASALKRLRAA
jgi:mRNA interferase RelE/StbE